MHVAGWISSSVNRAKQRDERGFVLVFLATTLTVLFAAAAFVVDIANWYLHAERLQRSADAAALGGAVYLPDDPAKAHGEATRIVEANGLASAADMDAHPVDTNPSRLYVELQEEVPSVFGHFLGLNSLRISRDAVAEYTPQIPMGSPSNVLGMEPPDSVWQNPAVAAMQGNYWLTIHGPNTPKADGARWTAGSCQSGDEACDRSRPDPGRNTEYTPDGQKYIVHVPPGTTGTLAIEVYDGGYVYTGLHCESGNLQSAEALDPVRYARGNWGDEDSPYCAGDTSNTGTNGPMSTTFTTFNPEDSPVSPGAVVSGCPARTLAGFNGDIGDEIQSNPSGDVAVAFHKWMRICTVNITSTNGGDYTVRVYQGRRGAGENQFALRAAVFNGGMFDAAASAGVSVSADSRVEMVTQSTESSMIYFLAKVKPSHAGMTLTTEMFSIGDDVSADVTILPPAEATVNGNPLSAFSNCSRVRPGQTVSVSAPNCTYPRAFAQNRGGEPGFAGRHGNLIFTLPEGFNCDTTSSTGCWLRIQMKYNRSGTVQDTTSWHTYVGGHLVRITE